MTGRPLLALCSYLAYLGVLLSGTWHYEAAVGRLLWGTGGVPGWWTSEVDAVATSQYALDWYTFAHVKLGVLCAYIAHGTLLYFGSRAQDALYMTAASAFFASTVQALIEVRENSNDQIQKFQAYYPLYAGDSLVNSLCDSLAVVVGVACACGLFHGQPKSSKWRFCSLVGLSLALEALTLYTVCDSFWLTVVSSQFHLPSLIQFQKCL